VECTLIAGEKMILKVTDRGVVIPRDMLPDVDEVDVRSEGGVMVVMPLRAEDDPILGLGSNPVDGGDPDASTSLDKYLYGKLG
jgi:hypothetical protein